MNNNNIKKFVQKKGNDSNNFGFIFSRQSQNQKNLNDSVEDGEIISSQKSISPDKLKATPSRQMFQNLDPESHEKNGDAQLQNGKSRINNEQLYQGQNIGNENNYNYGDRNYFTQNEKIEQDELDSQSDQSQVKSNENEPEPESMENQEQSQADILNQNYMNRRNNSQQNIGQLSSESNQENRGPQQNNKQTYQIQLDNENGHDRFNLYEQKEVLKVNQQNYEMSGEEAEMAEMQDDEGVDTIGGERKSINQRAQVNRQEVQEEWGKNSLNINTQLNQDMYSSMSEENEHDVQSGLLQQYQDEEDSSMHDKSQSQIYVQEQNNQDSSYQTAENKDEFGQNNDLQNSLPKKIGSNQDEITLSEMEATGNKQLGMNDDQNDIINVQDYDIQIADEKEESDQQQKNDYREKNYIGTVRMSRLGFADHELSHSKQSSSKSSEQDINIDESDQEEQEQNHVHVSQPNHYNQSKSNISRSKMSSGKQPTIQLKDDSEQSSQQQLKSKRTQSKNQPKESEYSIQKEEDNYLSQLQFNSQKKNETAQKSLTGQKQYLSQQEPIFALAQKSFQIDDQITSQQVQQQTLNNQSRISVQVESIEQDEDESSRTASNRNNDRRSRKSRQKSKLSHIIEEPAQNYQDKIEVESQNQEYGYDEQKQQQPVKGKQSRKSQKTLKSQKSRQTMKSRISNYKSNIQDNDSEHIQENDSEDIQEKDSQIQLVLEQQKNLDDDTDQEEIDENLDDEIKQSDQKQSDFKIDVEDNFVQNDDYSEDFCIIRGGADIRNNQDEPKMEEDQDEEEEQSNQDSAFNYQFEGASQNRQIEDIQNSESKMLSSTMLQQNQEEISDSQEQEESREEEKSQQENQHYENIIMENDSQDQSNIQIEEIQDNDSDEPMEYQSEHKQSQYDDDDQIEKDSHQPGSEYQDLNGEQIEQEPTEEPNEIFVKKQDELQKIINSDQNENVSSDTEQINISQDVNQDADGESEEGENYTSPDTSEIDSSSSVDTDLVSEEIVVIQQTQQQLDYDNQIMDPQRLEQSNPIEQIQKPIRKEKKKKEKIIASLDLSPRKTRGQKEQVEEQPQLKKEIEKFTIQRKPRAVQNNQEKEIEKQKSVDKKDDQYKKGKKDFSQNEQKESKQNKQRKNKSEEVEKIEDEINPSVVLNAIRKNASRKVNLKESIFSQSSEKNIKKSPIQVKEVKKSPIKEKEKKKSPIREKEKVVKLNYIDKFDVKKQEKNKIEKFEQKFQQQQTLKNREQSLPFSAYQNKDRMIKINQFQIQSKNIKVPETKKQEKQIDTKKIQKIEKVEIIKQDNQRRKTMFGLTSQDQENVEMTHIPREKLNKKVQEPQKLKHKENTQIVVQQIQKLRNSVRQNDEKIQQQNQKQVSTLQTKKHFKEEQNKKPCSLLGFQSEYSKNTPKPKLKTPSPKQKEKKAVNDKKSELSPIKTRNTLQSPPRVKTRNSFQSPQKLKTRSIMQSPQKEQKSSKPKNNFILQEPIKHQTRHSKRESPSNIITNDNKSNIKKDQVKLHSKKHSPPPKKSNSPLKIQEKQKQVDLEVKLPQKKENIIKIEKKNDSKLKEELNFTRKRDLKYYQKHSNQIQNQKVVATKFVAIEKIQTRKIAKPDYASLSLGLLQKSKNDIEQNPKQIKAQKQTQSIGLGFFNDDTRNHDIQKTLKQSKEQKAIQPQKPQAKISLDSFKLDKKQNLKTLIATPSKFQILYNKKKMIKKPQYKHKQKQDFIIRTRHSLQKPLHEKKDVQKIDIKSKQIRKTKQHDLLRKIQIMKNVRSLNEKIQTRRNVVQQTQKNKENETQKQKIIVKKEEIVKPIVPQSLKKTFQDKSSIQITKTQSPEKKFEKKEPQKLGLLGKKQLSEKNQTSRNDSKSKSQKSQFQFIETKKQRVPAEKEQGKQINRSSLFGFVSK